MRGAPAPRSHVMMKKAFAGACVLALAAAAHAQGYPQRPVRLVVPFPPGGANDVLGRVLGARLGHAMGQQIVVDNRGGANSIIGCDLVAKAMPDGYTILIVPGSHAINPSLYRKLPYDTLKDFASVSLIGNGAYVLLANPSLPANDTRDLVALAKAKPAALNYASAGVGNITHLAVELFSKSAGIKLTHVPYKGGGPAVNDVVAGHVSLYFGTVALAGPLLKSGRVKALGVSTAKRSSALPDVPTIAESGVPGFQLSGWYGLLAPAKTPAAIVARLNSETSKAVRDPDVKQRLAGLGIEAAGGSPAELDRVVRSDMARWRQVISELGVTAEQ
jgi:tripartite-type tricarboxylate transporter receptor subunit TctC